MSQENFHKQVSQVIKKSIEPEIEDQEQKLFLQLQKDAQNYLNQIINILPSLKNYNSLSQRISQIGYLMHQSDVLTQQIVTLTHIFQEKVNNFADRIIALTLVSYETGKIYLLTEEQTKTLYSNIIASGPGTGRTFEKMRGQSTEDVFKYLIGDANKIHTNPTLKKLQEDIDKQTALRGTVLIESIRRRNSSHRIGKNAIPKNSLYWHPDLDEDILPLPEPDGKKVRQSEIAQAYVNLIINTRGSAIQIEYKKNGGKRIFTRAGEDEIYKLSNFLDQYDTRPGTALGDVLQISSDGKVQLAVKAGGFFNTASVRPTIALAQGILEKKNLTGVELRRLLEKQLPIKLQKSPGMKSWSQAIYQILSNKIYETAQSSITDITIESLT